MSTNVRFVDEIDEGFSWIEEPRLRRTSHALVADGRVWVIDPFDGEGVEERVRALGEPAGVIQLLNRHGRDSAVWSERLGVPLHLMPSAVAGSPFRVLPIADNRLWTEVALWWPERRTLVCGDVLGTIPFFRSGDEPVGMHPILRLRPPRSLRDLGVEHLLVGHGEGIHGPDTAAAVETALRTARRRLPRLVAGLPGALRHG